MSNINILLLEYQNRRELSKIEQFKRDLKYEPRKAANTVINLGAIAVALHDLWKKTKDSDDKMDAIFKNLPKSAAKGLMAAFAGHTVADISQGKKTLRDVYRDTDYETRVLGDKSWRRAHRR